MLIDNYHRQINYLRISLTDKCNLRCFYCISKNLPPKNSNNILRVSELFRILDIAADLGINKMRLTGGEPLMREEIVDIVEYISGVLKVDDLSLTTNGILLLSYAEKLKARGLKRVNISLDTLNKDKFREITRGGQIEDVFSAIEKSHRVGFSPIKINVVVLRSTNDEEIIDFVNFGKKQNVVVRFIEFMPISESLTLNQKFVGKEEILKIIKSKMEFEYVKREGSTEYYLMENGKNFGIISPVSCNFCEDCNRLRLSSEGKLRVCLTNNYSVDLKKHLQKKATDEEIKHLFYKCVQSKPQKGSYSSKVNLAMWQIGG